MNHVGLSQPFSLPLRLRLWALLAVLASLTAGPLAHAVPTISTPVTDLAGVLSPDEREAVSRALTAHRAATSVQLAVLLVPTTAGQPIDDYSHAVAEQWAGGTAGQDRGVLFTLAVQDHHSRIEVGRGLEAQLTDVQTRRMLDAARPQLRSLAYFAAVSSIVNSLVQATGGQTVVSLALPGVAAPTAVVVPAPSYAPQPPQNYGPLPSTPIDFGPPPRPANPFGGLVCLSLFFGGIIGFVWLIGRIMRANWGSRGHYGGTYSSTGGGWSSGYYYSSGSYYPSGTSDPSYASSSPPDYSSSSSSSSSDYSSSSSSSSDYSSSSSDYSGGGGSFDGGGSSSDW